MTLDTDYSAAARKFLASIMAERTVQDAIWGGIEHDREHPPATWIEILGQRMATLTGILSPEQDSGRAALYRRKLIELAAVAWAAYEVSWEEGMFGQVEGG